MSEQDVGLTLTYIHCGARIVIQFPRPEPGETKGVERVWCPLCQAPLMQPLATDRDDMCPGSGARSAITPGEEGVCPECGQVVLSTQGDPFPMVKRHDLPTCPGSGKLPTERRDAPDRYGGLPATIGRCFECKAWVATSRSSVGPLCADHTFRPLAHAPGAQAQESSEERCPGSGRTLYVGNFHDVPTRVTCGQCPALVPVRRRPPPPGQSPPVLYTPEWEVEEHAPRSWVD